MQTAAQLQPQSPVSGLRLVPAEPSPSMQIVAVSAAWRKLLTLAKVVAPHLQLALIEGEQGVGKHTLARLLHRRSALAHTDFQRRDAREWLAGAADSALSGFLYLDRVDLLHASEQRQLLGILKSLHRHPAGRSILVASSQTSLRELAHHGQMLPDLALRLTPVRFCIPPLRQRQEDIVPLAHALLGRLCARYQRRPVTLAPDALACLLQHEWPGNARELGSTLEAALLQADNGIIHGRDLPIFYASSLNPAAGPLSQPEDLTLNAFILRHVQHVLNLNRGNKLRAARQLRISRSTLYRILSHEGMSLR